MAKDQLDIGFDLAPQAADLPYREVTGIYRGGEQVWQGAAAEAIGSTDTEHHTVPSRTAKGIVYYAQQYLVENAEPWSDRMVWCHSFALEVGQSCVGIASAVLQHPEYPGLALASAVVREGAPVHPAEVRTGEKAVIGNPNGEILSRGYQVAVHSLVGLPGGRSIQISGNRGGERSVMAVGDTAEILDWQRDQSSRNGDRRQLDMYTYRESRGKRIRRALWLTV